MRVDPLLKIRIGKHGDYEITVGAVGVVAFCWLILLVLVLLGHLGAGEMMGLVEKIPGF